MTEMKIGTTTQATGMGLLWVWVVGCELRWPDGLNGVYDFGPGLRRVLRRVAGYDLVSQRG